MATPTREQQDRAVQRDLLGARRELARQADEQVHADCRECQADDCSRDSEQRALGQELTHQAPSPGAKRHADRHLALALQQARQHQIGDAATDDEQEKAGGAEQDPERRTEIAGQLVAEGHGGRVEAGALRIALGVRLLEVRRHHREIGEGRGQRRSGPHPSERLHHARVAIRAHRFRRSKRARRHRHVDVVLVGKLRNRRQHANHRVRPIVHLEDLADDARIAAKAALPVGVAQHEHGIGAMAIVVLAGRSGPPPA